MAFIEKIDIEREVRAEELAQITRGDDTIIHYGVDVAISEMKSYLNEHYDVDAIFSKTGNSRHALLLNFGIDIAIYIMVSSALPGQDLEDRRARYKRAVDWLKKVNKGELVSDLPELSPNDDSPNTRGAIGSMKKRNNYF